MRILGLLSWWDEDPDLLHRSVATAMGMVDGVVALDGRYALFQSEGATISPPEQYDAIRDAGGITFHPPRRKAWDGEWGGEVAKRAALFQIGERYTSPDDWYYVFDSDIITRPPGRSLRRRLRETDLLVARGAVLTPGSDHKVTHPFLFRALRGLTVLYHHWYYRVPGGPVLWAQQGSAVEHMDASRLMSAEHLERARSQRRLDAKDDYYRERRSARVEGEEPKRRMVPHPDPSMYRARRGEGLTRIDGSC